MTDCTCPKLDCARHPGPGPCHCPVCTAHRERDPGSSDLEIALSALHDAHEVVSAVVADVDQQTVTLRRLLGDEIPDGWPTARSVRELKSRLEAVLQQLGQRSADVLDDVVAAELFLLGQIKIWHPVIDGRKSVEDAAAEARAAGWPEEFITRASELCSPIDDEKIVRLLGQHRKHHSPG